MNTVAAGSKPGSRRAIAWRAYALASLGVTIVGAGIAAALVTPASADAIWFSAALAYGLQMVSFGGMLYLRDDRDWFLAGWLGGMALRFGAVGGVAWWLSRSAALPRDAALLSLVAFVFVLLLLEPLFLRWDLRKP